MKKIQDYTLAEIKTECSAHPHSCVGCMFYQSRCVIGKMTLSETPDGWFFPVLQRFTPDEITIMKSLQTALKVDYICRDKCGDIYATVGKPCKNDTVWCGADDYTELDKELFPFIEWSDSEPVNISEEIGK